jgi:hypothetical protein
LFSISEISAQVYKVDGSLYDTIYAIIEHEGVKLRLVTTVYKDTLADDESIKVPVYPIVRNQKIEVYQNGIMKRWHYVKIPKRYAYTTSGRWVRYQTIPVLGLSVQQNGQQFFFMADGCETGCGKVGEFIGIYSMQGETMSEGYSAEGAPVESGWRKQYGYAEPDTEIDYAFSSRCSIKEVTITA